MQVSRAGPLGWHPTIHARPARRDDGTRSRPHRLESHRPDDARPIRDLLREARAAVREVSTGRGRAGRASVAPSSSTCARAASGSRATSRAPATSPSRTSSRRSRRRRPTATRPVILYCAGGIRSLFAAQTLQDMGYADVASMSGGFQAWKSEGRPFSTAGRPVARSRSSATRAICSSRRSAPRARRGCSTRRCCSSGAGGLGSPAMLYLAAAGVGTSASSTSTSSTSPTSSARSSTRTDRDRA